MKHIAAVMRTSQLGTQTSRVRNKLHSVLQFLKLALARARADGRMSNAIAYTYIRC